MTLKFVIVFVYKNDIEMDKFRVDNVMDVPGEITKRGYTLEPVHYFTLGVGQRVRVGDLSFELQKIMKA